VKVHSNAYLQVAGISVASFFAATNKLKKGFKMQGTMTTTTTTTTASTSAG